MTRALARAGVFWPGLACQEPLPRARQKIGIECDLRHRSGEVAVIIFPRRDFGRVPSRTSPQDERPACSEVHGGWFDRGPAL
jgi:hypothetical protein